jgi:3-phosphoshikimate 1-carboxyvinyltransferase
MLTIPVPGSKSITQRVLVACALSENPQTIVNPLCCDDSIALARLLEGIGHTVNWENNFLRFTPAKTINRQITSHCDAAGTTLRFGACLSLVLNSTLTLDGSPRLRERPLESLGNALTQLGVRVSYPCKDGHAPVLLQGPAKQFPTVPRIVVDASESSQFVSGLLLIAPYLKRGLVLHTQQNIVSKPYVDMTLSLMQLFGVDVKETAPGVFVVPTGCYHIPPNFEIESDWSSAAFLLAAAQITGTKLNIPNLPQTSLQGDAAFLELAKSFQSSANRNLNLTHTPDLIAPLAALAAFANGTTTFHGAAHARTKECDRISVLSSALASIGCDVQEFSDGFSVTANSAWLIPRKGNVTLNPYDDHRMAMCFGLLKLGGYAITIENQNCVSKSFPQFWESLGIIRSTMA